MDYCLTTRYRFPSQILQVNEGLKWLFEHSDRYPLDMDKVILFGSSAGAVITAILGCAASNPVYADSVGVKPALSLEAIKGVCIDGAPPNARHFDWRLQTMFRSWMGSTDLYGKKANHIFVADHVTKDYPLTFLTAGNSGCFKEHTHELQRLCAMSVQMSLSFIRISQCPRKVTDT